MFSLHSSYLTVLPDRLMLRSCLRHLCLQCVTFCVDLVGMCVSVWYLSILHYNQPALIEDCDSFSASMSRDATRLVLHQNSEWTHFPVTRILLICKSLKENKEKCWKTSWPSCWLRSLSLSLSHLDKDILAEAREEILEAVKADVMSLPYSAAHTVAQFLCTAPLPVLTHAAKNRACYVNTVQVSVFTNQKCKQSFYQVLQSIDIDCPDSYGLLLW